MKQEIYKGVSTTYKNVHIYQQGGSSFYRGKVMKTISKDLPSEREAALWVDKTLIKHLKEPINILVRK